MPSRPFKVRSAIFSPPGMAISISRSRAPSRLAAIIARGPGFMAGSPGAIGRPGRVAVPTPSPALNTSPAPGAAGRTVTTISAPWVTSGSSPASFTTPARAQPSPASCSASAKAGRWPPGSRISTGSGKTPVRSAWPAARAAAVAQAPVVQPRRNARPSFSCQFKARLRQKFMPGLFPSRPGVQCGEGRGKALQSCVSSAAQP